MKGKKVLLLFIGLLLPGFVFVFLKIFGKNEFEVPALYQEGDIPVPVECNYTYQAPYIIPDSIQNKIEGESKAILYILNFSDNEAVLNRLMTETKGESIRFVAASELSGEHSMRQKIRNCVFLSQAPADLALLDSKKKIRGHYSSAKLDDVDRLLLEIKIILKKY